jgi:Zn-finger nucleic acid-binding protein
MAYRDEYEHCPRCRAELTDAVVGLACASCRGIWIKPASVQEMVTRMQLPPEPIELRFATDGNRESLRCPTCGDGMKQVALYSVPIDVCDRHGIWFDAEELATVLLRAAPRS